MKITEATIARAIMQEAGLSFNQKFNVKGWSGNPHYFSEEYIVIDNSGLFSSPSTLIDQEIEPLPRFKNREEMHTKLKELANDFKPDWNNFDQRKFYIRYGHGSQQPECCFCHTSQPSPFTIYFRIEKLVLNAINYFTLDEWKMYFGVDE